MMKNHVVAALSMMTLWVLKDPPAVGAQGRPDQYFEELKRLTKGNVSVTGCLQKGSSEGRYALTGEDGKQYELKPANNSVRMDSYVGRFVTILGVRSKGRPEAASVEEPDNPSPNALEVTLLTMVHSSCE